jgi:uncharacterized protein YgiB involved in biofilm formation
LKKSLSVPLVFLGTLGLSACQEPPTEIAQVDVHQEFYSSLEDCAQDWGSDPANCTPETSASIADGVATSSSSSASSSGGGGHGGSSFTRYSGPRYYWFRTESGGGYPVAIDHNGDTRRISQGFVANSGPSARPHSVSSSVKPTSLPSHLTATPSISRGGFGRIGSAFAHSSGG